MSDAVIAKLYYVGWRIDGLVVLERFVTKHELHPAWRQSPWPYRNPTTLECDGSLSCILLRVL